MSLLIKNVEVRGQAKDILIEKNRITQIAKEINVPSAEIIDGRKKAAIPGLINGHTHAAMTLLRGYADDLPLTEWLEEKIWPCEAKMTEETVYWGTKLACLEMIKSGTTFFNDMYWHLPGAAKAVEEMGIRAALSAVFIDLSDPDKAKEQIELNKQLFEQKYSERVAFALGPHAIYTVSKESLIWARDFANEHELLLHIHVAETEKEVDDSVKAHGMRPFEYLESIGFLGSNVIACHSLWMSEKEIAICAKHDVKIVYNPHSNLKLASGHHFPYKKLEEAGVNVSLGTDGCASNNNLDMLESAKFAALIQKSVNKDPTLLSAEETFDLCTKNGATTFKLESGTLEEGKLADILLIDLERAEMTPNHNLISNLIYAANGGCVDTMICDGKILMRGGKVKGEKEIMAKARSVAQVLLDGD
jgi:5-methylthioadenosine/S-adenosylhomocysteine deaminase